MGLVFQMVILLFSILFMLFGLCNFIRALTDLVFDNKKIEAKNTESYEQDSDSNL